MGCRCNREIKTRGQNHVVVAHDDQQRNAAVADAAHADTEQRRQAYAERFKDDGWPEITSQPPADEANDPTTVSGATFILDDPPELEIRWGTRTEVLWASGES